MGAIVQARVAFFPVDMQGEVQHEIERTRHVPRAGFIRSAWTKGRQFSDYGAPYRIRFYHMNPASPEAVWFAELAPGELSSDPKTPDTLSQNLSLPVTGNVWVTYQVLNASPQLGAHIVVGVTVELC